MFALCVRDCKSCITFYLFASLIVLQNRTALLKSRKSDPAVLVDIPQGPSVEDFAAAGLLSPDVEDKKVEPAR